MTMAIEVRPPMGGPRTCTRADGNPKSNYGSLAMARRTAKKYRSGARPYSCGCGSVHLGHRTAVEL